MDKQAFVNLSPRQHIAEIDRLHDTIISFVPELSTAITAQELVELQDDIKNFRLYRKWASERGTYRWAALQESDPEEAYLTRKAQVREVDGIESMTHNATIAYPVDRVVISTDEWLELQELRRFKLSMTQS